MPPMTEVQASCSGCFYSELKVMEGDGEPVLLCRRNPPFVVYCTDDGAPLVVWPQVTSEDWCGEYADD